MGLHHRRLLTDSDCDIFCHGVKSCSPPNCDDCPKDCHETPPSSPASADHTKHYLIIGFSIVAAVFFLLCCYVIYVKFFSARNRSRRRSALIISRQQQIEDDDFVDEEHDGAMVDHPIWYIRTTGLQQSIISAITVCKYNKGEGLIEGTECSVCLAEFQEDESLRLLPKCNHAFHLPCIDTWLRSHTNCPMCRAPIVTDPSSRVPIPPMEPNNVLGSSSVGSARMEALENSSGIEDGVNGEEEEGREVEDGRRVCETESTASEVVNMQQPRRSVSLDSSSAAKISLALSHGNNSDRLQVGEVNEQVVVSKRVGGNGNLVTAAKGGSSSRTRSLQSAPSSMKRSRSFNGKHLLSWYSRSQKKSNAPPLRSF